MSINREAKRHLENRKRRRNQNWRESTIACYFSAQTDSAAVKRGDWNECSIVRNCTSRVDVLLRTARA